MSVEELGVNKESSTCVSLGLLRDYLNYVLRKKIISIPFHWISFGWLQYFVIIVRYCLIEWLHRICRKIE